MKKAVQALYGSKAGKILPVLLIAGMVATASASVFVLYYGSTTATVGSNDVKLFAGSDSATCTSNFPCINVSTSSTNDFVTIAMNLGKAATNSPQPATYFTNATVINNGGSATRSIQSVSISNIASTHAADFGSITVYYCTAQTNDPATNCARLFAITSTTGGSLSGSFPVSLAAGASNYLEFVGYAGSGATNTDTITFNVQIQWA